MITFAKLWLYLERQGKKRTDLLNVISSSTLAKLGKNDSVTTDTINRICEYLGCSPYEIMDYVDDRQVEDLKKSITDLATLVETMLQKTDLSKEQIRDAMIANAKTEQDVEIANRIYNGEAIADIILKGKFETEDF